MDDEKKIIEKRSSFRGWKERNKGKSQQKKYIIGIAAAALILSVFIIFTYSDRNENVSTPISVISSNVSNNSPFIGATPEITTPEPTELKSTPIVTPEITSNIIGKMGTPFILNEFEINVTKADSSSLHTSVWVIVKNIKDAERSFNIGHTTVVIDNIGQQYERVQVERAGISQTNMVAKAMRDGAIFFDRLREGRSPKKLILEINGQKAEVNLE